MKECKNGMQLLPVILVCVLAIGCELIGEKDDALLSGEVEANILKVNYTLIEKTQLLDAINAYELFNVKWGAVTDDSLHLFLGGEAELFDDYEILKNHYFIVENLVISKWPQYDAETRRQLERYQDDAIEIDKRMNQQKTIKNATEYAEIVLGTILKMMYK